jgi:putative hydrolase of the HAD superfamily
MLGALRALGTAADATVVIGDRPDKDVAAAAAAGMRAIRVRTGEYRARPDHDPTWAVTEDAVQAVSLLEAFL